MRDGLLLLDSGDQPVGRLSRHATSQWLPRLDQIEQIRIDAILRQYRRHCAPDYLERCRCEQWEVRLVEIPWRAR